MPYSLTITGRNDTRYTIFENNQVLTADQLNDLHQYLNIQDRATRTRAIGVGIIGGLEVGQLANGNVVVSRGAAITTDGDLAWCDADLEFDGYAVFTDPDAKYAPFRSNAEDNADLVELVRINPRNTDASKPLKDFNQATNTNLRNYTGVLYLEEYELDADQCTGADCDNRGKEAIHNWRFLLANDSQLKLLMRNMPKLNNSYFSLGDVRLKRIVINPAIDTYAELQASFGNALSAKDDLKTNFEKLWNLCGEVADDLLGNNPVPEWQQLLDSQFAQFQRTIFVQYLYDYCRDLADAYQELKELLFDDNSMLCPDIQLFPKHVLLGSVKSAAPIILFNQRTVNTLFRSAFNFNLEALLIRFHSINFDEPNRHIFYESPVLNAKGERRQQIRFGFVRLNALIKSFNIPDNATIGNVGNIRITPGNFVDKQLGSRAIPYYFGFGKNTSTVPAYWSYEANVKRKENLHRSYFAQNYSQDPFARQPFGFDMAETEFYRIEGHIGFKYPEVERRLTEMINQNNLPINIMTVQVERNLLTVPVRPWYFNFLHQYELIQRRGIVDQLTQAELTHNSLSDELKKDPSRVTDLQLITPIVTSFNTAKSNFVNTWGSTQRVADSTQFFTDVESLSKTASDLKANTKQFAFSNTAAPHDFVINSGTHIKLDLINDLINQHIDRKKNDLLLGNFLVKNPGLEHAAGVLRGGTFVLVYTSNDNVVIADFMLPYASVDNDLIPPPVIKPLPVRPRYEIPKLFEKVPNYESLVNRRFIDLDTRFAKVNTDFASNLELFTKDFNQKNQNVLGLVNSRMMDFDNRFANVNDNIDGRVTKQVNGKLEDVTKQFQTTVQTTLASEQNKFYNSFITTLKLDSTRVTGTPGKTLLLIGDADVTTSVDRIKDITSEIKQNPNMTPEVRKQREQELNKLVTEVNSATTKAAATGIDADTSTRIKAVQFDIAEAMNVVTDAAVRTNISNANTQIRGTVLRINR
ncbi:hypothetical protein BH10BAC3_BH10BAC3_08450 [soil metagenome]